MRINFFLWMTVFLCLPVFAQDTPPARALGERDNNAASLYSSVVHSRVQIAEQWGLEEEEIERYEQLMIVEQHFSSSQISPIEVLGKNPRTQAEAERYAKKWVDMQLDQTQKSLTWVAQVSKALDDRKKIAYELVAGSPPLRQYLEDGDVNTDIFWQRWQDAIHGTDTVNGAALSSARESQRVYYFLNLADCNTSCHRLWETLRERQDNGTYSGIDVIFVRGVGDAPTAKEVGIWGVSKELSKEEVASGNVTLNWDGPEFQAIRGLIDVPFAMESRGAAEGKGVIIRP